MSDLTTSISSMFDLTGRRAFVTGGGKGIGAAITARLIETGAIVTIGDLDPDSAGFATDVGAGFARCDITVPGQLDAALDRACGEAGSLDIVINNAGIYPTTGPMREATDEFVHRMLDVNVRAQFSVCRESANRMANGGSIVNLASIAGIRGGANISAYSASKAAVMALTRAFAAELGPTGIRVNAIAPGVIDTPGVQDQLGPLKESGVDIEKIISANPLGLTGHPDHIARVAVFLASDLAAFVTGQTIVADGGSTS